MNTKPLTLEEAGDLIDTLSTEDLMNSEQIQEFIGRVEEAGKEILKQKKDVGKYVESASQFLLAAAMAECLQSGDMEDMMIAMQIAKAPKLFTLVLGYAFIYAVGLCAEEELR